MTNEQSINFKRLPGKISKYPGSNVSQGKHIHRMFQAWAAGREIFKTGEP